MNSSQLICEVHNTRIGLHRRIANEIVIELAEAPLPIERNEDRAFLNIPTLLSLAIPIAVRQPSLMN